MQTNPTLCNDPERLREAREAVDEFVAELQAGIDNADARTYNAHFADDVLWGSPYGETVVGFDTLHAIHRRLLAERVAGSSSRYEAVHIGAPAPDVAVAHVRRVALDEQGRPIPIDDASAFSEMALYVLVRRDGQWWLAAGQNTMLHPKP
ncbi:MAG: SgcJ/EcaC family oxidoreductase [Mycobacterium sp.]